MSKEKKTKVEEEEYKDYIKKKLNMGKKEGWRRIVQGEKKRFRRSGLD